MSALIVITYEDEGKGFGALEQVAAQDLDLQDAAVAVRNEDGRVLVRQTLEHSSTGSTASWGNMWGLLTGLTYRGPGFWALVGAALGVATGEFVDLSQPSEFLASVSDTLQPGGSALFMLAGAAPDDTVLDELAGESGSIQRYSLAPEFEARIEAALTNEQVQDNAHDSMDLIKPLAFAGPQAVFKKVAFDFDSPSRTQATATQHVEFDRPILGFEAFLRGFNINYKQSISLTQKSGINVAAFPVEGDDRKVKVLAVVDTSGPFTAVVQGVVVAQLAPSN